jgi:copper(I)-binding protein
MTRIVALWLFAVVGLAACSASAHDHLNAHIEIVHAWAPAASQDAASMTVYMTIRNTSGSADRLIGALARIGGRVEIHRSCVDATPVAELSVDAGQQLELNGGGPCLIVSGLHARSQLHESFKMAIEFERAGRVLVDVIIGEPAAEREHQH